MAHYLIELDLGFGGDEVDEASLHRLFDEIADAAADLTDGIDGDVSANTAKRTITIHLSLDDETDESAFSRGVAAAHTVVHAAGGPTPDWDKITLRQPTAAY